VLVVFDPRRVRIEINAAYDSRSNVGAGGAGAIEQQRVKIRTEDLVAGRVEGLDARVGGCPVRRVAGAAQKPRGVDGVEDADCSEQLARAGRK